jgi:DNA-3-methyladenine glycosylase
MNDYEIVKTEHKRIESVNGASCVRRSERIELPCKLLSRVFFEAPPERVARRLLGKILVQRTRGRKPIAGRIVEVEAYLGPHRKTADPAAHSHRGPTPRNQVLFGPAGHAYVYSIYGRYFCMNVTCEREGRAGCVLLRALEPLEGLDQMARNRGLSERKLIGLPPFSVAAATTRRGWSTGNRAGNGNLELESFPPFSQKTREGWGTDDRWGNLRELTGGPGRLCQALGITRSSDNGLDLLDPKSPLQLRDDGTRAGRVLVTRRIGIRHAVELPLRFAIAGNGCVSGPKAMAGAASSSVSISSLR